MPAPAPRPLLFAMLAFVALAATASTTRAGDDDPAARKAKVASLEQEVMVAFREKRYADAEAKCREQIALAPIEEGPHYNLACALARQGKTADALASLTKAVDLGFDDADHMGEDEDLVSLHDQKGWADLVAAARASRVKAEARLYEPAQEVKGVKTLEGDPAGGLRWRLRMAPDAGPKKPQRLVVWLHPSGGSMNATIEPMSVDLAAKGWALLVPTQKRWESWSDSEAKRLLETTLPDVAKVEGVDAKRPVLMGFSAGGQMALNLWVKDPARFGGLVLDAAYPIDTAAYGTGHVEPMALPTGDAVKGTPLFVVVGDADPGHMMWKQVADPWRAAGVPLRVIYIPGGEHRWLFGRDEADALFAWLSDISAGRVPGPAPVAPPVAPPAMSEPAPAK